MKSDFLFKTKKFLISILLVVTVICCLGGVACSEDDESNSSINLQNWVDQTETVEFGSVYYLRKDVEDDKGNKYKVTCSISCNERDISFWDYSFRIEETKDYIITYSCYVTDKTIKTTLKVSDAIKQDFYFVNDNSSSGTELTQSDVNALGFSGKVNGNVVKFGPLKSNEISTQSINIPLSYNDLISAKSNNYKEVEVAFCFQSSTNKSVNILGNDGMINDITPVLNTWSSKKYPIDNFINVLYPNETFSSRLLFSAYVSPDKRVVEGQTTEISVYISICLYENTKEYAVEENEIVKIHNENALNNINGNEFLNIDKSFVSSYDINAVYSISGEYAGNAVKCDLSPISGISILPRIEISELEEKAKSDDYEYSVIFWVSGFADNEKQVYLRDDNSIYKGNLIPLTKTWQKVKIDLTEENYAYFYNYAIEPIINKTFGVYMDGDAKYGDDGLNTTVRLFISDVYLESKVIEEEVPVVENEIVKISNSTSLNYITTNRTDLAETSYISASDMSTNHQIIGDYTGNAVMFRATGRFNGVKITPRISKTEFAEKINAGYTNIVFYVAGYADNGNGVSIVQDNSLYVGTPISLTKTWTKITLPISSTNYESLYDYTDFDQLFSFYGSDPVEGVGATSKEITVFIGDIMFDEETREIPVVENEIVKISNSTSLNYITTNRTDLAETSYISASDMSTNHQIIGDYTGNAVMFRATGRFNGVKITPRISKTEFAEKINAGYTNIVFYVAGYADNGNGVSIVQDNSLYVGTPISLTKTWTKITLPISSTNYESLYDYTDFDQLFSFYGSDPVEGVGATSKEITVFIGDIMFEKPSI